MKRIFVLVFIMATLIFFSTAFAFVQDLNAFRGDAASISLVTNDFNEVEKLKLSTVTPFYLKIFGGRDIESAEKFFRQRIKTIYSATESNSQIMAQATIGGSNMTVGRSIEKNQSSALLRVSTYLHESTHSSGAYDVSCTGKVKLSENTIISKSLEGRSSCGEGLAETYAISYLFLRTVIQFCTNCSEKQKMEAELFADYQLLLRIENDQLRNQLIQLVNIDPVGAERLAARVVLKKQESQLSYLDWASKCLSDLSCF